MPRKKIESYVVEGVNWKCKVDIISRNTFKDIEDKLIEAATLCFEHIFGKYPHMDVVDLYELKDENGIDYFKNIDEDSIDDEIPDPSFGFVTKIYSIKDLNKADNHYVIPSKFIFENASNLEGIFLSEELEKEIKFKNPVLVKTVNKLIQDSKKHIIKFGDLN